MPRYAGIDLGATSVSALVGDETGTSLGSAHRRTPTGPDGDAVSRRVVATLEAACEAAGVPPTALTAVGIGAMGPLDLSAGAVDNPVNLDAGVRRVPLTDPVAAVADTDRVYLHNDTDAGAIGERFYRDDPPTDMVYLTISSGIGAGVFVGGDLLVGANGNAGEVGHITVDAAGTMTCRCGTPGHWEAYCSGHNVPRYARVLFERGDWSLAPAASGVGTDEPTADADADADPDLDGDGDGDGVEREGRGDPPAGVTHGDAADPASGTAARATALPVFDDGFDAATVYDAAGTDPLADRVLERLGEWNAIGVADLVHSFAPDLVAVGGAVALNNPDAVLDPIRRRLPDRVYVDVPRVELTALGDEVVLKGALASALTGGAGGTDA